MKTHRFEILSLIMNIMYPQQLDLVADLNLCEFICKVSINLLRDKENPYPASSEAKQMRQRGCKRQ